jgi:hypothetical protein
VPNWPNWKPNRIHSETRDTTIFQFLIIFSRGAPVDFGGARRSKFQNSYCVATWVLGGAVVSSGTYMCRTCPPPPTLRRNAGSGGRFVMASSPLLVSMGLRCHDKPAASTNIAVQCGYWRAGAAHVNEFSMSSPWILVSSNEFWMSARELFRRAPPSPNFTISFSRPYGYIYIYIHIHICIYITCEKQTIIHTHSICVYTLVMPQNSECKGL